MVEYVLYNGEVEGSNPARCWAFFLFSFNFLTTGLSLKRNTINKPFKRGCLVAQLGLNKVKN